MTEGKRRKNKIDVDSFYIEEDLSSAPCQPFLCKKRQLHSFLFFFLYCFKNIIIIIFTSANKNRWKKKSWRAFIFFFQSLLFSFWPSKKRERKNMQPEHWSTLEVIIIILILITFSLFISIINKANCFFIIRTRFKQNVLRMNMLILQVRSKKRSCSPLIRVLWGSFFSYCLRVPRLLIFLFFVYRCYVGPIYY